MTREEYIHFANALKNNYTIDFDKLSEFCDMAISALEKNESAEEWYKLLCEKWDEGNLIYNFPKGMTNGDVLIILFPNLKYTIHNSRVITTIGVASSFDLEWWNAPYKAESEE